MGFFKGLATTESLEERLLNPSTQAKCFERVKQESFCLNLKPFLENILIIRHLINVGVDVTFVTTPFDGSSYWHVERHQWLENYFGDILKVSDHLIFSGGSRKSMIQGDVLIEDNLPNLLKWSQSNTKSGILINKPYNQTSSDEESASAFKRVDQLHLGHVMDLIKV